MKTRWHTCCRKWLTQDLSRLKLSSSVLWQTLWPKLILTTNFAFGKSIVGNSSRRQLNMQGNVRISRGYFD